MAPIVPELFPASMRQGLDALAIIGYKRAQTLYQELFNLRRVRQGRLVEEVEYGDLSYLEEKAIGAPITMETPEEGWRFIAWHKTYALGLDFAEETIEDDMGGISRQYIGRLAGLVPKTIEHHGARVFNHGDTTTYHTCPDGVALFANNHRLTPTGPQTYDTLITSATLSAASLQAALTQVNTRKDEHGHPIDEDPVDLIVPPALEFKGAELLVSTHSPEDDSRHINAVRNRRNLRLVVYKMLTSASSWGLKCRDHGLTFFLRVPAQTGQGMDVTSGNRLYKIRVRFTFGVRHPRGIIWAVN